MAKLSTTSVFGDLLVDGMIHGNVTGNLTGNASTATSATTASKADILTTARNIALGGILTGSASFNGSANITINASIAKPPKSGDWFSGGMPIVGTDGVLEVGKYIDFHNTDTSTNDYDVRLQANTSTPCVITLPTAAGTLARTSDNVASATKLQTPRTINGTNFDGSANITTANWGTARTLTIGNKGQSVNGSGNITWSTGDILGNTTSLGKDSDWNTANATGIYEASGFNEEGATGANRPVGAYSWGGVLTLRHKNVTNQIYLSHGSNQMWIRGGWNGSFNTSWARVYTTEHKPTYSDVGAAAASHGTHVTWSTTTPKANGTATVGSETKVARGDHVHPLQTSVSGNAGTATKLATAREIKIGNTGKNFDGSANVSWTLSEIGAAASSHNHTHINRSMITTPIYNASTGILIDFNLNEKSGAMVILKLYGNSYSANPPIEAIYQFYDYAGGTFYNPTGSAISGQPITLKVYKVGGKIKAWFQQPQASCTFKLEVAYGNNSSTPNVTLSNAAEPTGATETITITPNRVYSAAYKPTAADIGAAASSHSHNYLPLAGGTMTGAVKVNALSTTWVDVAKNSKAVISATASAGTFHPLYTAKTTNGSIVLAGYQTGIQAAYLTKANVDAGTNSPSKTATLFDENGGGTWPGTISANSFTEGGTALSSKYAAASHGTHVTYATAVPKVAGTAAIGTVNRVAREDHVHPLQTSVSGNAGTATKLATARTIQIGNKSNSFDGSANITYTLADIGAAATSHTHNQINSRGNVTCESGVAGRPAVSGLSMSQAYNNGYPTTYGNVISLKGTGDGQILVGWSGTDGAHAPVYVRSKRDNTSTANWSNWAQFYTTAHKPTPADIGAAASSHGTHVDYATATPKAHGTAAVGTSAKVAREDHVHPAQTSVATLTTARTLTIGSSGKSFNGSANVSWSHNEIQVAKTMAMPASTAAVSYVKLITFADAGSGNIHAEAMISGIGDYGGDAHAICLIRVSGRNNRRVEMVKLTPNSNGTIEIGYVRDATNAQTTVYLKRATYDGIGKITILNETGCSFETSLTSTTTAPTGYTAGSNQSMYSTLNPQVNITGNAATSTKLATARNIKIGNATKSFNGTANVEFTLAEIGIGSSISAVASNLSGVTINGYDSMMTTINSNLGNL